MIATVIIYDERVTPLATAETCVESLWLSATDMQAVTGWKLETAGLCRGDACVRVDNAWCDADGRIDLMAFARHMGQPVTRDDNVVAFGESVNVRNAALFSPEAPDFSLPDLDGVMHSLSDYRGKKVFLHSWGSY